MSKVRLYEIAKELGKESKEIVARAKELGIEVKSHASSVESEIATRITASFSQAAAPKKETTQKPTQSLPKEQPSASTAVKETTEAEKKAEQKAVAPTQKSEVEMKSAPAKPKSRNFKAEREARAKEQAERRNKQRDNRPQKQQNVEKRNREERNPRNDRNNQNRNGRGNRGEQRDNRNHRNQDNRRQEQNRSHATNQNRPQTNQGPRIDFKARAAALKAEQNAEYARGSEERFKQAQAAKAAQREQNKRKEPVEELFQAAAPIVEATKPAPQPQVAPEASQTPAVDTRRKKQARPDKKRDDFDREEDGPRKQQ
ncbi:MAG: translation initiation factor IF-2 N-terminal domain-containing protein, partial [Streptococcus anginosus]|nr:translation initiation factor IF-2 N-terminal domain-containing protein [Streptococcus anginosus]